MKATHRTEQLARLVFLASSILISQWQAHAQGTITFNQPWIDTPGVVVSMMDYYEQGMWFRVVNSFGQPPVSPIERWSAAPGANSPYNGTPFIKFFRDRYDDHVLLSMTDGGRFGLISVDLADWVAPSFSQRSFTFNGYRPGYYNPYVSVTFTTAGGGTSSFETFYFPADFASGLAWVAIPSAGWAMDNLVWVPEPSTYSLLGLALLALAAHRCFRRRKR